VNKRKDEEEEEDPSLISPFLGILFFLGAARSMLPYPLFLKPHNLIPTSLKKKSERYEYFKEKKKKRKEERKK
jgi:hypothetical protein